MVPDTLSAEFYYRRAGLNHDYGFYEKAIDDYNKALAKIKNNGEWWYARGVSKMELDLYNEAIEDFNIAEKLKKHHYIYNMRGICCYFLENYDAAIAEYDKAIALKNDFAEGYNNRGVAKIKKGDRDEGCAEVRKALQLGDKKSQAVLDEYCNPG